VGNENVFICLFDHENTHLNVDRLSAGRYEAGVQKTFKYIWQREEVAWSSFISVDFKLREFL
jgi:hypothetical protein